MPGDLHVVTEPHDGGFRYAILRGAERLLVSGTFSLERDARSNGEHIAADPVSLADFLKRNPS